LEKLNTQYAGDAIPFREAMIQGNTEREVLSDAFIRTRANALSVAESVYKEKAKDILDFCVNYSRFQELRLWFGKDSFCQLNLLTLLALLEKIEYRGKITLFLIDDENFDILEKNIPVSLGGYQKLYEEILIQRIPSPFISHFGVISQRAIELYYDYLSPDGALAQFILKNKDKSEDTLMKELLSQTKEYGLSDLNILSLINRILKNK
jgi:hypothetical protein